MKIEWIYATTATVLIGFTALTYNNLVDRINILESQLDKKVQNLEEEINILELQLNKEVQNLEKEINKLNERIDDHRLRLIDKPLPCVGNCPLKDVDSKGNYIM